jgi:hypothetical protein
VRLLTLALAAILTGCSTSPAPRAVPKPEPTAEAWYSPAVEELVALNQDAEVRLKRGRTAEAGELINKGLPLAQRIVSVPRPTLAAVEAASDLDDLYGRVLFDRRQYGWARLQFQKNVARWKNWRPQTEETQRRRQLAEQRIAECDRRLAR